MIRIEQVTYRYPGSNQDSLSHISLEFDRGQIVALMGANGSGKTTLIRCMNGLLKPCSGTLTVDELDLMDSRNLFEIRRRVGMVFQNPDNQIVTATVEREIAFGLENLECPAEQMLCKVNESLRQFHLESYRHTAPHLLSGGERQRLALAAVWVMAPYYLILDEPTSLLDPQGKLEILDILQRLKEAGSGILFITQSAEEALTCDRLIVLKSGTVAFDGRPDAVFPDLDRMHALGVQVPVIYELKSLFGRL
jgi:energy-coupling factor transport system ATP-binding protein